ncbi:pseudouridylate synthase RPUSD4, mitochondrial [Ambystoma mexicanum]|uniref:pseudouridylate synthase RPUSD4, mitochondrial n=1 Tax=Ambystoma mexicanum TaxID=8296 RepID=UPI0037E8BB7E
MAAPIRGAARAIGRRNSRVRNSVEDGATESSGAWKLAEKLRGEKKSRNEPIQEALTPLQQRVRELVRYTKQLQQVHPNVLAKALTRGIVYKNDEIVVIDKPYGVPVHGGPGVKNCVSDVLPVLAKMLFGMQADPLRLCHRLDKETTGVMVLARSEEAADRVHKLFRTRQVHKIYWALSVGVPVPSEGILEIPILEQEVQGRQQHYKMMLAPNYRVSSTDGKLVKTRLRRDAQSAVTQYRVLDSLGSSALVELQPITGIKHQLRVHMAFGLGCPILGDHKYSHWDKLAPQKLSDGALKKLGLEQAKVRYLPLHLHARQLCLPGLQGGKDVTLVCKPPRFFLKTLQRLKLTASEPDSSGSEV